MSSLRRKRASRANGSLSQGPVTPEGKQRSSKNATRHGLLAACLVLPGESVEAFENVVDQYLERFAPVDAIEEGMVEEMAGAFWRMRRCWSMETKLLSDAIELQTSTDNCTRSTGAFRQLATAPELGLLLRYETRLHMMFQRALHNIVLIREKLPVPPPGPGTPAPNGPQPIRPVQPTGISPAPAAPVSPDPAPDVAPPLEPAASAPAKPADPAQTPAIPNEPNPISDHRAAARAARRLWWRKRQPAALRILIPASGQRQSANVRLAQS